MSAASANQPALDLNQGRSSPSSNVSYNNMKSHTLPPVEDPTLGLGAVERLGEDTDAQTKKSNSSKRSSFSDSSTSGSRTSSYAYNQESFETYKLKVITLCHDIGLGEPTAIERMNGGSFNRVVGLSFASRQPSKYVLRIPRDGIDYNRGPDIKDQVALLQNLIGVLPVAEIAAYDSTQDNAIASSYILQHRLPGLPLDDVYYKLSLEKKLQIVTQIADLMIKMEGIRFETPGRLAASDSLPSRSTSSLSCKKFVKISGFRQHIYAVGTDMPALQKMSLTSLLHSMIEQHIERNTESWAVEMWRSLQTVAHQMEQVGMIRKTDENLVQWHWDFAPRNIMINCVPPFTSPELHANESYGKTGDTSGNFPVATSTIDSCCHSAQISGGSASNGSKHTVDISVECNSSKVCNHSFKITVEDSSGTIYRHTVEIVGGVSEQELDPSTKEVENDNSKAGEGQDEFKDIAADVGSITGILDWDGALSVPLVITRTPATWLWANEDERSCRWSGNFDIQPARALNDEELLIKAHFDQIMSRNIPNYLNDAYGRGPWIRRLAKFAIHNFSGYGVLEKLDAFVAEWAEYYSSITASVAKGDNDETPSGETEDGHSGEDSEGDEASDGGSDASVESDENDEGAEDAKKDDSEDLEMNV